MMTLKESGLLWSRQKNAQINEKPTGQANQFNKELPEPPRISRVIVI